GPKTVHNRRSSKETREIAMCAASVFLGWNDAVDPTSQAWERFALGELCLLSLFLRERASYRACLIARAVNVLGDRSTAAVSYHGHLKILSQADDVLSEIRPAEALANPGLRLCHEDLSDLMLPRIFHNSFRNILARNYFGFDLQTSSKTQ